MPANIARRPLTIAASRWHSKVNDGAVYPLEIVFDLVEMGIRMRAGGRDRYAALR